METSSLLTIGHNFCFLGLQSHSNLKNLNFFKMYQWSCLYALNLSSEIEIKLVSLVFKLAKKHKTHKISLNFANLHATVA